MKEILCAAKYTRVAPADFCENPKVIQLRQDAWHLLPSISSSDRYKAKRISSQIRSIRLADARKLGTHTNDQWNEVLDEFHYRCVKCGCYPEGRPTKDHIVPLYLGGSDSIENLQPLCRQCNTGMGRSFFDWAAYRRDFGFCDE